MVERRIKNENTRESQSQDILRNLSSKAWEHLRKKYELEYSAESEDNINQFNELLASNSGVIYINHTSSKDVPVAISLALSKLSNAKQIIGPAGMKHYDFSRDPLSAVGLRLLKLVNIHALPVVQVDDTVNYGEKRAEMLKKLKLHTKEMITRPGSLYGIAPEGTRNEIDGTLQRANRGLGYLADYQELYYLPMALMYKEFTKTPGVVIGKPKQLIDIIPKVVQLPINRKERAQIIADIHMIRLAELMPLDLRGTYRDISFTSNWANQSL